MPEFNRWLLRARPGDRLAYHRGYLVLDRPPVSGTTNANRRALSRIADTALRAAEDGSVHLVQRRHGPFDFTYLAIKRPTLKGLPTHGFVGDAGEPGRVAAAA